jgi:hypothetical protein
MVTPYNHRDGLQFYTPLGSFETRAVRYRVPAYEVFVGSTGPFRAIRFALRNNGKPPESARPCDTGLSHERVCRPTWVPTYSPHSFRGRSRPGAWQLIHGKDFLIHEGPGPESTATGGSIGCIEILDGKWGHFLWTIEDAGNGTCAMIGAAGKLTATIEAADYPAAMLVR